MVSSNAKTVSAYLHSLPADRRVVVQAVRELVTSSLPPGFEECMQYGMISWIVPPASHAGPTYNGQPIAVCSLAAQKNAYSLYMMGCYGDGAVMKALEGAYKAAGKRLDMGKSCVRFKRLDDLVQGAVAQALGATGVDEMIAQHDAAHGHRPGKLKALATTPKTTTTTKKKKKTTTTKKTTTKATKATTKKTAKKATTKKTATTKATKTTKKTKKTTKTTKKTARA